jgi:hypothetical protein
MLYTCTLDVDAMMTSAVRNLAPQPEMAGLVLFAAFGAVVGPSILRRPRPVSKAKSGRRSRVRGGTVSRATTIDDGHIIVGGQAMTRRLQSPNKVPAFDTLLACSWLWRCSVHSTCSLTRT